MSIIGYWKTAGKHPVEPEERRILHPEPPQGDYAAVYQPGTVARVDIDDFSHATGEPEGFVRNAPRSAAVLQYLDALGYRYNAIRTEHGVHIVMGMPDSFKISANRLNWFCALGIKIEVHVTKVFEPLVVNGLNRQYIHGSMDSEPDPLPPGLFPIQKGISSPFDMRFENGDRNNHLSEYAFYLTRKGLTADQCKEAITGMNEFILEDPLDPAEVETIMRPETMEKLAQIAADQEEKNLTHVAVGQEIIDNFHVIRTNRQFYQYAGGVYEPVDEEKIDHFIRIRHPGIKKALKSEALDYLKGMTYQDTGTRCTDLVNVRNGLLHLDPMTGEVQLLPHTPEIRCFTQFNAAYDPAAESTVLGNTLDQFFDGNQDMILLFSQMLGYLLMNNTIYQKCFFFVGAPSSGKSKILNMVTAFCGKPFVSTLSLKDLDDRFRSSGIIGKVANINADLENSRIQTTGNFKSFVTGDGITLERKNEKPIDNYVSTAKLIFACNQYPDFSKDSEGVFRRVITFPCNHVFRKTDPGFNPRIDHDLQTPEAMAALLNMAITGYLSLQENDGFLIPDMVAKAGDDFRAEADSVFRWLREAEVDLDYLLRNPLKLDNGTGLYPEYRKFCIENDVEPKAQQAYSRTICNEYGLESYQKKIPGSGGKRCQMFRKK